MPKLKHGIVVRDLLSCEKNHQFLSSVKEKHTKQKFLFFLRRGVFFKLNKYGSNFIEQHSETVIVMV